MLPIQKNKIYFNLTSAIIFRSFQAGEDFLAELASSFLSTHNFSLGKAFFFWCSLILINWASNAAEVVAYYI